MFLYGGSKRSFPHTSLEQLKVLRPAAWSAIARLNVWNQSSLSPKELSETERSHAWSDCMTVLVSTYNTNTCKQLWKCSLPCWESDGNIADLYPERVEHIVYDRFTDLQTHENTYTVLNTIWITPNLMESTNYILFSTCLTKKQIWSAETCCCLTFIPLKVSVFFSLYLPSCWG